MTDYRYIDNHLCCSFVRNTPRVLAKVEEIAKDYPFLSANDRVYWFAKRAMKETDCADEFTEYLRKIGYDMEPDDYPPTLTEGRALVTGWLNREVC